MEQYRAVLDKKTGELRKVLINAATGSDSASLPQPEPIELTDDQLRQMARGKLSTLLQTIDATRAPSLLLSVCRELLDRIEGKATQRIEQKVEHTAHLKSAELTNEQIDKLLLQFKDKMPAGVKLLDDGSLITDADYQEV